MWVGPIPEAISRLTIAEQMLLSLYHPRCFVFKLYPRDLWTRSLNNESLQRGLRGNVTTYELNLPDVVRMLDGRLMPRPLSILASTIAVTYIGPGQVPKDWLKRTFRVRRAAVYEAFLCLKYVTCHPGFQSLEVSEEILATLPEDNVPIEILANLSHDLDIGKVQEEADTYLPHDGEMDDGKIDKDQGNRGAMSDEAPEGESSNIADQVPDAIPLQYLGAVETDLSKVSTEQLLLHNLTQGGQDHSGEGGYAVRHSRNPVSEFPSIRTSGQDAVQKQSDNSPQPLPNYSVYTYPCLYPYGEGGIEAEREVKVPMAEHVRCNLLLYDKRFSTHHSWMFTFFSILQKRQALLAARVQMNRKDFDRASALFSTLTQDDLSIAADEEANQRPISNPKVRELRRFIHTSGVKVMGSDSSRFAYRSQIWSTSVFLNPPSLWITINPTDLHDPIVQIFIGEQIDLDDFRTIGGPNVDRRAQNIAQNPVAAVQFFHFLITLMLEKLFGVSTTGRQVLSTMGVLGRVQAYYGVVEAQGRGSLHVHMLLWLQGAPSSDKMHTFLQSDYFRHRLAEYVNTCIRAHLDNLTEDYINTQPREAEIPWSSRLNPDSPGYMAKLAQREQQLAHALQVHKCKQSTCLVYRPSLEKSVCKRRAPFPLSTETVVKKDGEVLPKRSYGYLNAWNPSVLLYCACNNDIKFISNGGQAKSITWYITAYQTKKQQKSHNLSALLVDGLAYHFASSDYIDDIRERSRILVFRCLHVLNRQMEQSAQQVASYLLGYGDTFRSHTYVPLYWSSFEAEICRTWPELRRKATKSTHTTNEGGDDAGSNTEEALRPTKPVESEQIIVERAPTGILAFRSQLTDYRLRGDELENYNLLNFVVNTYETANQKDIAQNSKSRRGRPRHTRSPYLAGHPRSSTCQRVVRREQHNVLPNIVGPWLPRSDDPDCYDLYCASILALLRPWRNLTDLRNESQTWTVAFESFCHSAAPRDLDVISNLQYYYQCKDAAEHDDTCAGLANNNNSGQELDGNLGEEETNPVTHTESDLQVLLHDKANGVEAKHGAEAVALARKAGLLPLNDMEGWNTDTATQCHQATRTDLEKIEQWQGIMARAASEHLHGEHEPSKDPLVEPSGSNVISLSNLSNTVSRDQGAVEPEALVPDSLPQVDTSHLKEDQLRAYKIIEEHLTSSLAGCARGQLLMQIQGEGGTGKSTVISCVTELFQTRQVATQLVKSAYTGIAASLIDGSTLHSLCHLSRRTKRELNPEALELLRRTWAGVRYLFIDEVSMVSRSFLARLSSTLGSAKQNDSLAFGGLSVILAGDFHQFPPVACAESEALFHLNNPAKDKDLSLTGRAIYEQFRTVVILKEQCRTTDEGWLEILRHVRHGKCTPKHLSVLKSLIISPNGNDTNSIDDDGWKNAVLVTPRHGVRNAWNAQANRRHCARTGQRLLVSPAEDTIAGRPLTLNERWSLATKKTYRNDQNNRHTLPDKVELAVGMEVMVTINIETELDIANGARGIVEDIILDSREDANLTQKEVGLRYPPACVLVRLNRTKAPRLPDLDQGVVPITPMEQKFLVPQNGKNKMGTRRQIPITSAYAFTDYRAQGQTLNRVIVDIGRPPHGKLTPFNVYVALSRSSGRETIRLLRGFDEDLFTTIPSVALEEEDRRLHRLDQETKVRYEQDNRIIEYYGSGG